MYSTFPEDTVPFTQYLDYLDTAVLNPVLGGHSR